MVQKLIVALSRTTNLDKQENGLFFEPVYGNFQSVLPRRDNHAHYTLLGVHLNHRFKKHFDVQAVNKYREDTGWHNTEKLML